MIARLTPFLALLCLTAAAASAEELRFPRYPAPSPDGALVAFCYQGDIWVVPARGGEARRITVHPGYDSRPVWSPDGRWLAFQSTRNGNRDVYVVGYPSGRVRRLTFHSAADSVACFSPDGTSVLFTSYRPVATFVRPLLYRVSLSGGMPALVARAAMGNPAVSHDGSCIAFERGSTRWWRRGYRGSAETKLWLCRPRAGRYGALLDGPGNHRWPLWGPDGKTLYYVSDGEGENNLWRLDLVTMARTRLTAFSNPGVRFPSISHDGKVIAFCRGSRMFRLATSGGEATPIAARAPLDGRRPPVEHRVIAAGAQDLAVSRKGKEAAFVVRGEAFALSVPPRGGKKPAPPVQTRARRLTRTAARERHPAFSPDGKTLVVCSDRSGNYDLFAIRSADPKEPRFSRTCKLAETRLTDGPQDETHPRFSPDGGRLAFRRGRGDLVVRSLDDGSETTVLRGWNLRSFRWSPDGRWFALCRSDDEYNSDVFLLRADGSAPPLNVSQHPDSDGNPVWFPNGRGLAFVSRRNRDDDDLWMVFLRKEDFEAPPRERWRLWTGGAEDDEEDHDEAEEDGEEEAEEGDEKRKKGERRKEPPVVRVDAEDIHLRLVQLTSLPGDESGVAISEDSLSLVFRGRRGEETSVWTVAWDGTGLAVLTDNSRGRGPFLWRGRELFALTGSGAIQALSTKGGRRSLRFQAVLDVDHAAERRQMFFEAWRLIRDRFYDPGFHGADWKGARRRYEPLALAASCPEDFRDAVRMMLGELNASHLGISGPRGAEGPEDATGCLGVTFDLSAAGPGLKVATVVEQGPADRETGRLRPDDRIETLDGQSLTPRVNIHRLLNHKAGHPVLLRVTRAAAPETAREVVLRPCTERQLSRFLYEAWVRSNRRRIGERSGDRIAYVHVRGMNWSSFERFERELYSAAHGKAGLLIDVRNNGGGWTADMLLAVLSVRPHAVTRSRGSGPGYPQGRRPFYAWTRPAAVLCNERSFSNAEIFSHAFKTLKRGPLVGRPTHGGVISTGGTVLLDGSWFRLPTRGWWVAPDGPDMELHGAAPDHDVALTAEDEALGRDPQLEKAVAVLLAELEKD